MGFFFGGGGCRNLTNPLPLSCFLCPLNWMKITPLRTEWLKEKLDITYTLSLPEAKTFTEAKCRESWEIRRRLNHFTSGRRQALSNVTSLLKHQLDFYPLHCIAGLHAISTYWKMAFIKMNLFIKSWGVQIFYLGWILNCNLTLTLNPMLNVEGKLKNLNLIEQRLYCFLNAI